MILDLTAYEQDNYLFVGNRRDLLYPLVKCFSYYTNFALHSSIVNKFIFVPVPQGQCDEK